jgi:transcriptional regulator with XRE-family HTH domain
MKINKKRIEEYLKFRRWNKSDLAKALNFSESYITLLLNNSREPSCEVMERFVLLTGLSLDELFFCSDMCQKTHDSAKKRTKQHKATV